MNRRFSYYLIFLSNNWVLLIFPRIPPKERMPRSDQMMRLEKQELSEDEREKAMERMITDITNTMPKSLWDER